MDLRGGPGRIQISQTSSSCRDWCGKTIEKLAAEMNALAKEFIQKNYDNVLGPGVFIMLCSNFPYPVMTPLIEEIIEEAPDRFKNNSLVKDYVTVARSNMEKLKAPH